MYMPIRKEKALLIGITSAISASIFYFMYHEMTIVWALVACSVLFTLIAARKYRRDAEIKSNARKEQAKGAQTPQTLPPMTSKGSRRLFVPPPLSD